MVLFFTNPDTELGALSAGLRPEDAAQVRYLMVLSQLVKVSPDALINQVAGPLQSLFPQAAIGAGTDAFFTELNRERIRNPAPHYLGYSLNPQIHAYDNDTLTENLAAQADTVTTARSFAQGKAIHISPVSLKMRWNPAATGPTVLPPPGELPPDVCPRQMSLYGAIWTLGSIKYLAEAGADAITYYETVGKKGLMQSEQPTLTDQFVANPGELYPVYHLLKALLRYKSFKIRPLQSSHPLVFDGLALDWEGNRVLFIANFTENPVEVALPLALASYRLIFKMDEAGVSHSDELAAGPVVVEGFGVVGMMG
ncbi:MAG: hypothetical protein HC880_05490 [Bacteroidia bacterium]|nr:hypothetical protein [Bacteroidia bacterium]